MTFLTKYEVTRVVGLRSLQLSEGATPLVHVAEPTLRCDTLYVAALELWHRALKAKVRRDNGTLVHVWEARLPPTLTTYLDTRDGGTRFAQSPYAETSSGATTES